MNETTAPFDRLLVDRPVTNEPEETRHVSSLRLACQDQTDYAEAAVRLTLVVCLLVSLFLCGLRLGGGSAVRHDSRFQIPAWSAACLKPALPKVQINAAFRYSRFQNHGATTESQSRCAAEGLPSRPEVTIHPPAAS